MPAVLTKILAVFLSEAFLKWLVVFALKKLSALSTNKVDDEIVAKIEELLK